MSKFPKFLIAGIVVVGLAGLAVAQPLGLGRLATPEEIAAWDIDVRPDGQGLPVGSGDAGTGDKIFQERCAACHGDFGEGAGRWPVLAGGFDTLDSDNPVKTIGSYWPYLSTVYDYIRRAMPFGEAQSLSADETYSLVAYLLYLNDVVDDENFELSNKNFTSIRLPNEKKFVLDPRREVEKEMSEKPCMTNCKTDVKVLKRARVLDVTPTDESNPDASVN